jgi:hypothetical protein
MGMIDGDDTRNLIFLMQKKLAKIKSEQSGDELKSTLNLWSDVYAKFTNKWGIKLEDVPDYSVGLKLISKKYQAAFKSAIVDGVEALG